MLRRRKAGHFDQGRDRYVHVGVATTPQHQADEPSQKRFGGPASSPGRHKVPNARTAVTFQIVGQSRSMQERLLGSSWPLSQREGTKKEWMGQPVKPQADLMAERYIYICKGEH